MKFKIPEIKIPKVGIPKSGGKTEDEESVSYEEAASETEAGGSEVLDELESTPEADEKSESRPKEKPKSYGMVISEDQLRMIWAGEIGFSLLIVLASVLIAIAN